MDNRIYVYEEGGGGLTIVGQAAPEANMKVRFHSKSGGSADGEAELAAQQTDYLKITGFENDIITGVSHVSSGTYTEYAHNVYVKSDDTQLNAGDNWPDATGHYPFE